MATAKCKVNVAGDSLHPYFISIEQFVDWHHRFEVTVSTEKAKVLGGLDASASDAMDKAITMIGGSIEIEIEREAGVFNFKGVITNVQLDKVYAGDSLIIFTGYAPTYLLEGHPNVASYEEESLKNIFNDILSNFPQNLSKEVNPAFKGKIDYVVRYKETQYEFLSRLAAIYGEWFYYDGQKLVIGELPSKNPQVSITLGSDSMLYYNYGISVRPTGFKHQSYNYLENNDYSHDASSYTPGWLDPHSKTSHKVSKKLFSEKNSLPVTNDIPTEKYLKRLAEIKKESILSDAIEFSCRSANPGITIGTEVEVKSQNGFIGKFRVISAKHEFNNNRNYSNAFIAIPVKSLTPPLNKKVIYPRAESQVAEVTDNVDPDQLGRVRVKCKWQEGQTPWIRVLTNHAGKGYGTFFIPEIGDEVMLEFEQGNPDRPYVIGSKYHGKIKPEWSKDVNNLKAIKTRSGHTILFDDTDGKESITIIDKKENQIVLNTKEESILISAKKKIRIESEEIELDGKKITITASSQLTEKGNNVTISAKNKLKMNGDMGAELVSNTNVDISGKTAVKVVSDVSAELGGNASVKVQSSGITEVKGSLVKIN